jgi:LysR family transcriptional regulator, pca operon transcriptional activator
MRWRHEYGVSRGVVDPDSQRGTFRLLTIDASDTQGPVDFTTPADTEPSPTLRLLMDTIARKTADLVPPHRDATAH